MSSNYKYLNDTQKKVFLTLQENFLRRTRKYKLGCYLYVSVILMEYYEGWQDYNEVATDFARYFVQNIKCFKKKDLKFIWSIMKFFGISTVTIVKKAPATSLVVGTFFT